MSKNPLSRTELLVGPEGIEKLKNAKVMVFGVGGVGSFTVEALARTGVGTLILVDNDTVDKLFLDGMKWGIIFNKHYKSYAVSV